MNHSAKKIPEELKCYLDIANKSTYHAEFNFNEIFVNWYQDGNHYIGPHSDDESSLYHNDKGETIVYSITLQEEPGNRIFRLKPKSKGNKDRLDIPLLNGQIVVMGGLCQKTHTHQVPKTKKNVGRRINITIRAFKSNKINSFSGKYEFLSNFYPVRIKYQGIIYPTSEHAFQASKSLDPEVRKRFSTYKTPGIAKRMGRKVDLRPDWESVKVKVMMQIVYRKFRQHPVLAKRLLATGNQDLIEGNTWNDTYWGVCRGQGKNYLGKILMKVRKELKECVN